MATSRTPPRRGALPKAQLWGRQGSRDRRGTRKREGCLESRRRPLKVGELDVEDARPSLLGLEREGLRLAGGQHHATRGASE